MSQAVDSPTKEALDRAASEIKRGNISVGKAHLERILEKEPENVLALLWMTRCIDSRTAKIALIEKALSIEPDNPHALKGLKHYQSAAEASGPHSPSPIENPTKGANGGVIMPVTSPGETKSCPHCAETIKSAAVVCKHCGTRLDGQIAMSPSNQMSQSSVLDEAVAKHVASGFQVVSQSPTLVTLKKPKSFNWIAFILWWFLIAGWLYLLYYLVKKDEFVTLRLSNDGSIEKSGGGRVQTSGAAGKGTKKKGSGFTLKPLLIAATAVVVGILACTAAFYWLVGVASDPESLACMRAQQHVLGEKPDADFSVFPGRACEEVAGILADDDRIRVTGVATWYSGILEQDISMWYIVDLQENESGQWKVINYNNALEKPQGELSELPSPPTSAPIALPTALPSALSTTQPVSTSVSSPAVDPISTVSSEPSPTAASGLPDCPNIEWVYLPASLHTAYDITNTGSEIETVTQVVTSWAGGGLIHDYKFGGIVIKTHSPPATPVPIVVEFEGNVSARQLHPGQTKTFEVGIPGNALAMTLDLVFDGACHISSSSK